MPQIADPITYGSEPSPGRVRWTRQQCEALLDAGILEGRYELIDGEIISKKGQKPQHRIAVILVSNWLRLVFGNLFIQSQSSIDVAEEENEHNEPEPDAAVTREPTTAYTRGNPGPKDLLLAVEVSDTTLRFDRGKKAALYAAAGVPDYWVLGINGRRLFVCRQPTKRGYLDTTIYSADESVSPLDRPDVLVRVNELLPPIGNR